MWKGLRRNSAAALLLLCIKYSRPKQVLARPKQAIARPKQALARPKQAQGQTFPIYFSPVNRSLVFTSLPAIRLLNVFRQLVDNSSN